MVYVTGPVLVVNEEGAPMLTVGAVLSTVKVVLGPVAEAVLPAASVAVPAAMEIPSVPSPVMLERVTVRVVAPVPDTATIAFALPVLLRVISPADNVTPDAPE